MHAMSDATQLIGRERESRRLDELLDDIERRGAAALVVGEPGIGKSALVSAMAASAETAGLTVLRAGGAPSETWLPFAGLHQLLAPRAEAAEALPSAQREAIGGALGLSNVGTISDRPVEDRYAVSLAALNLLRDLSEYTPLLVVVEDLHWLDPMSRGVLAFVARRISTDRIVVVGTLREAPEGVLDDPAIETIELGGLDAEHAARLVTHHAPSLDPTLHDRLLVEAAGNPLALTELAIAWAELPPGTLVDSWVPLTSRLTSTFLSRAERLEGRCRTMLLTSALGATETSAEILAAGSLQLGRTMTVDDIQPAVRLRLIEVDASGVHFRHPLIRSAIHDDADEVDRREAHAALASVITDADRALWHRAAATVHHDDELAAALEELGGDAARRGAVAVAVTALERSAQLTRDPALRGHRLVRAAEYAVELGRHDVVQRLLDETTPLDLDPVDRARAAWRRRSLEGGVWRDASQVRALVEVTDQLEAIGDVETALDALGEVSLTGWWTNFDDERRALVVAAAERLTVPEDHPKLLSILGFTAPHERGAAVLDRLSRIDPEGIDPIALARLAATAQVIGDQSLAWALLEPSVPALRAHGGLNALSSALASRATVGWLLGDWNASAAAASEAARLAAQVERPANAAVARVMCGVSAAARGDADAARVTAEDVEREFRPLGAVPLLALASFVRGLASLGEGDVATAHSALAPLFVPPSTAAMVFLNQIALSSYFDAAVAVGAHEEALQVHRQVAPLASAAASPMMSACADYGGALLGVDAEQEDRADARYRRVTAELQPWPFLQGRLMLAHGSWLRRRRRVSESRAPLRAARDRFDALGAVPWGDRARSELRASGEVSSERRTGRLDALTAQELEIARLAASGLTNREIGRQLYLSHRTVGSHLYHVFPKLGITSRAELARALEGH